MGVAAGVRRRDQGRTNKPRVPTHGARAWRWAAISRGGRRRSRRYWARLPVIRLRHAGMSMGAELVRATLFVCGGNARKSAAGIASQIVDYLVWDCSAASRRLKVVIAPCPVELFRRRCGQPCCRLVKRSGVGGCVRSKEGSGRRARSRLSWRSPVTSPPAASNSGRRSRG